MSGRAPASWRRPRRRFWFSRFSRIAPAFYLAILVLHADRSLQRIHWALRRASAWGRGFLIEPVFLGRADPALLDALEFSGLVAIGGGLLNAAFPFLLGPCFRWSLSRDVPRSPLRLSSPARSRA